MLLHSSSSPQVPINIPGALGAAHSAIGAFFKLWEVFRAESKVWWVFNHRAFLEALCIGGILRGEGQIEEGEGGEKEQEENDRLAENDPLFIRGRADIGKSSLSLLSSRETLAIFQSRHSKRKKENC